MRQALLILLLLTACSAGNDKVLDPALQQHFEPGVTTQYEVETLYGRPQQIEKRKDCLLYTSPSPRDPE